MVKERPSPGTGFFSQIGSQLLRGLLAGQGLLFWFCGLVVEIWLPKVYLPLWVYGSLGTLLLLAALLPSLSAAWQRRLPDTAFALWLLTYAALIFVAYANRLHAGFVPLLMAAQMIFGLALANLSEYVLFALASLLLFACCSLLAPALKTPPYPFLTLIAGATLTGGLLLRARYSVLSRVEEGRRLTNALLNALPDTILTLEAGGQMQLLRAQPELEALLPARRLDRQPFSALDALLMPVEGEQPIAEAVEGALQSGESRTIEARLREGSEPRFFSLGVLRASETGGTLLILRDITERSLQRQQLLHSEIRYQTLVEKMNEGLIVTDQAERILFVNSRLCEILARPEAEMLGRTTYEVMSGEQLRQIIEGKNQLRRAGISDQYQLRLRRPDGSPLWVLVAGSPYVNPEGSIIGSVAILSDISAQKQTEIKLQEKNDELDAFVYKASHDLRGPLASIIGLTQIARDEVHEAPALRYLDLIARSAKRLDSILSELLDLTRMNKSPVQIAPVEVGPLVEEIIGSLRHHPGALRMAFRADIPPACILPSDRKLLGSIFQNLIANSINYQREGAEPPYVCVRAQEEPGAWAFEVSDNGQGIPAKLLPRVFEMFFRGTNQSKGSGLGLYIVKLSIEKLGGHCEIHSTEGEGTRFFFTLPRQAAAEGLSAASALPPPPAVPS
jgi:PAS domain S-box-containing protein